MTGFLKNILKIYLNGLRCNAICLICNTGADSQAKKGKGLVVRLIWSSIRMNCVQIWLYSKMPDENTLSDRMDQEFLGKHWNVVSEPGQTALFEPQGQCKLEWSCWKDHSKTFRRAEGWDAECVSKPDANIQMVLRSSKRWVALSGFWGFLGAHTHVHMGSC